MRTISRRTSPAAKDSPSFFFQDAIPPSVIVGLMAGMPNFESAFRRAETCRPDAAVSEVIGIITHHVRLVRMLRARLEAMAVGVLDDGGTREGE